jgi:competence ComEA-like helix-hairpin-helix protein
MTPTLHRSKLNNETDFHSHSVCRAVYAVVLVTVCFARLASGQARTGESDISREITGLKQELVEQHKLLVQEEKQIEQLQQALQDQKKLLDKVLLAVTPAPSAPEVTIIDSGAITLAQAKQFQDKNPGVTFTFDGKQFIFSSPSLIFNGTPSTWHRVAAADMNASTAKEMASILDLPMAQAEAIVQYRNKNGKFARLEDVEAVPGVDAKRLEGKKDRIVF